MFRYLAITLCVASMTACTPIWRWALWHRGQTQVEAPAAQVAAGATAATAAQTKRVARAQPITPPNVRFLQQGYLLGVDRGQWVYCRREIPTGSRLPRNSCVSEERLLQAEQDTRDILDAARRMPVPTSPCGFTSCGGGGGGGGSSGRR